MSDGALPYPTSLCHSCAAKPRYVETKNSTFILCPLLPVKYPAQPVVACAAYRPRASVNRERPAPPRSRKL